MRLARLDFYEGERGPVAITPSEVNVEVVRRDPAINDDWPESEDFQIGGRLSVHGGPIWSRDGGYLIFSDPNANTQYKYTKDGEVSVYRHPSGYSGADVAEYGQPGSNGLKLDREGHLTINEHGTNPSPRSC
jgi:gluconolactonase